MKITVVGTGYVGLVTGTCLAETGNEVTCVDIDHHKIKKLKQGKITIYEPGLEQMFERNQKQDRLLFSTDLSQAIVDAEIIFLALPTPPGADGAADLQYVLAVAEDLGRLLSHYCVIVDKSTVPVGTAEKVRQQIAQYCTVPFDVVSNPEFLREGVAVEDFMKPERIVIGTNSARARKIMETLYAPYVRQGNPIIFMDERSAELTKYAANAFLATKISFMNEIANMCEKLNANVDAVRKGIGTDSRIGNRFLFPGIGYGGSCFPKDVQALAMAASEVNYDFRILKAVMTVNDRQKRKLVDAVMEFFNGNLAGKTIAVWGLAFKPHTDDIREAPALTMIKILLSHNVDIIAYDPEAMNNVKAILGNKIRYAENLYECAAGADALIVATEWPEFRSPDFERLSGALKNKTIFDGRNLYDPHMMRQLDYRYVSIGRPQVDQELNTEGLVAGTEIYGDNWEG